MKEAKCIASGQNPIQIQVDQTSILYRMSRIGFEHCSRTIAAAALWYELTFPSQSLSQYPTLPIHAHTTEMASLRLIAVSRTLRGVSWSMMMLTDQVTVDR